MNKFLGKPANFMHKKLENSLFSYQHYLDFESE